MIIDVNAPCASNPGAEFLRVSMFEEVKLVTFPGSIVCRVNQSNKKRGKRGSIFVMTSTIFFKNVGMEIHLEHNCSV